MKPVVSLEDGKLEVDYGSLGLAYDIKRPEWIEFEMNKKEIGKVQIESKGCWAWIIKKLGL